jgi:hypothetical protein
VLTDSPWLDQRTVFVIGTLSREPGSDVIAMLEFQATPAEGAGTGSAAPRGVLLLSTERDATACAISLEYAGFGSVGWLEVNARDVFRILQLNRVAGLYLGPGIRPPPPMALRRLLTPVGELPGP